MKKYFFYFCLIAVLIGCFASLKTALAYDTAMDGRLWVFYFNIPSNETTLNLKFADWVNNSSGIKPGSNIQIYSAQSSNAPDQDSVIVVNNSSKYDAKLYLIPRDSDSNVRVIVQAFQLTDASITGTILPTAEYDDGGNIVNVIASDNIATRVSIITNVSVASTTSTSTDSLINQSASSTSLTDLLPESSGQESATTSYATTTSAVLPAIPIDQSDESIETPVTTSTSTNNLIDPLEEDSEQDSPTTTPDVVIIPAILPPQIIETVATSSPSDI